MILLTFYGTLALLAALATVGDDDLRWIGFWLVIGYVLSNVLHFFMPVTSLPGPYSVIEILVLLAVSVAWDSHRHCWPLLLLGAVNVLSICADIAFAAVYPPIPRQIYNFELTTNLCFAAECLLVTGVGLYHGLRVGRFARLSDLRRRAAATNVARAQGKAS